MDVSNMEMSSKSWHDEALLSDSDNMTATNTSSSSLHTFQLNTTDVGLHLHNNTTENMSSLVSEANRLGTTVTIAIALGSAAFVIIIVIIVVCLVRKKYKERKSRAWVDNLTLSYIADSNIDLTKDNYDEMISLDNDNFLNSLVDTHSFSVYSSSSSSNTRQYTYSYF